MGNRPVPELIESERIYLKRWQPDNAAELQPLLIANLEHLRLWIPPRAYMPAPLPELSERLAGFASDFDMDREWRFAIRTLYDHALIGEASLFARSDSGRVPLAAADRLEIGYWIDAKLNGQGFATEATTALLNVATTIPAMTRVEIRCDSRNAASAAIPRRLGFVLADDDSGEDHLMIWYYDLSND